MYSQPGIEDSTRGTMILLRKILVTTDLSEHSLAGFEHALSFGLLYGSKVYVLHVMPSASPALILYGVEADGQLHAALNQEAGVEKLNRFVAEHVGGDRKIIPVVRTGDAVEEIMRFAEEENVDLIVLATHGWTGVKHMLVGSVAEKLVRHSTIPVLTVKPAPMREEIVRDEDVETELHLR